MELDELKYTEAGLQWKETARWIKYEENVEAVENRWGKPHLAFLNFHALFSLRKGLEAGMLMTFSLYILYVYLSVGVMDFYPNVS